MCGICGIFTTDSGALQREFSDSVRKMTALLERRGPDDEGFWEDPKGHLQLGFRRLSILDLTPAGHQPMISGDGRSVIIFNGEIYNFSQVRHELEQTGITFRSRSDSEVLLEALNLWGPEALSRLNGMFALAFYNTTERTLLLARDHAGIKPLYYYSHPSGKGLAFGSQYNILLHTPWGDPGPVRPDVLHLYLRLHHMPAPYSLLENTYQLEPGHYLLVNSNGTVEKRQWWMLPRHTTHDLNADQALEELAGAMDRAIRRQRISDVPLGVFLSGGIDSPLITAIARRQAGRDLRAFTIGNPGWVQDESKDALFYARQMDVEARLFAVSGDDALQTIPEVISAQYEPFADFSMIPVLLISRLVRKEITVALSGDGGDELFFGYERPLSLLRNGADFRWPWPFRMAMYGAGKYGIGPKRSSVICSRTPGDYYFSVNSRLKVQDLNLLAPGLAPIPPSFRLYDSENYKGVGQLADYSRWVEFYGQLQRGLKKVDMASMYHSLEVRVPFLDREVIELSLRVNPFDSMRNGRRKSILRDLLGRYVPADSIPVEKRGFSVPLKDWLRGPLQPLVEDTLFSGSLYPEGIFDRKQLRRYWNDHLSGTRDLKWGLWTLLSLQWWNRAQRSSNDVRVRPARILSDRVSTL
jgi:asparagine synthase (glutamine-hydrolysing)